MCHKGCTNRSDSNYSALETNKRSKGFCDNNGWKDSSLSAPGVLNLTSIENHLKFCSCQKKKTA